MQSIPGKRATLHSLEGHETARSALARSFLAGRLPQVLLLQGPSGVGKQRFALWMGQLVLCSSPQETGPCGTCRECSLALRLEHPELHWYFPIPRPPSRGSEERDREAFEETRSERLQTFRDTPLRPSFSEEVRGLHLGTIRNLRRELSRKAAMGSRRLFVIAQAEELVAQESSPEAANALLKVLEEPPDETWIVLTASEPGRLLPTIRSRATAMYVPPLPSARVLDFLRRERDGDGDELGKAAELSGGSIGRAVGFLSTEGKKKGEKVDGPLEKIRKDGYFLLSAALDARPDERFARALGFRSYGARGLHELLTSLEAWMRDLALVASGAEASLMNGGRDQLSRTAKERGIHPPDLARAIASVEAARTRAAGNVNPQLVVIRLLEEIHRVVGSTSERTHTTHLREVR